MKKRNIIFGLVGLFLGIFIVISSCDNGGNDGNNGDNENNNDNQGFLALARMDIEDANTVFIAPSPETSKDALYKITDSGNIKEIAYFDETNKKITLNNSPSAIYNANKNYVIICFGGKDTPSDGYLIRKNDGAVFSLENVGLPSPYFQLFNYKNTQVVQNDAQGNIYYLAENRNGNVYRVVLLKIDISNPNSLIKTDYAEILGGSNWRGFDITSSGHAVYFDGNSNVKRIRLSNGGLYNLPNHLFHWIGLDDKIKYYNSSDEIMTVLTIDNNFNVIPTEYMVGKNMDYGFANSYGYIVKLVNRVLIVSALSSKICEIENAVNTMREISIPQITTINLVDYTKNNYYLSGYNDQNQPVLLKINSSDDVATTLLPVNQYDIYAMSVDANDILIFNALRMNDGARIIGEISASNQLSILDSTLNTKVTVLERIR